MPASPWKTFPPSGDWPHDDEVIWVRLRSWTRKPFPATFKVTGEIGHDSNGAYVRLFRNNNVADGPVDYSVFWIDLDAWKAYP